MQLHIVSKFFFPVIGGIEQSIEQLYSRFPSTGWEIVVHTGALTETGGVIPESAPQSVRGLSVRRYLPRFGFYWPRIPYGKRVYVSLQNFDLLPHLPILLYAWVLSMIGKKRAQLFLTPHGGFCPNWHTFSVFQRVIKKGLHNTIGTFLINRVIEKVQVVSEWEREQLVACGVRAELMTLIENGLEDAAFADADALASEDIRGKVAGVGNYILQVGKLYEEKNYETSIRALALLPTAVEYVILGQDVSGQYTSKLQQLARELGVEDRLHFWGYIEGVDKYFVYRHALALVHMARWENFCTVVHEALSQGLVCVVSDRAVLPHLVRDGVNGFCVELYNFQAEADKIKYILDPMHATEVEEMRVRNKAYGRAHAWESLALATEQFYIT